MYDEHPANMIYAWPMNSTLTTTSSQKSSEIDGVFSPLLPPPPDFSQDECIIAYVCVKTRLRDQITDCKKKSVDFCISVEIL